MKNESTQTRHRMLSLRRAALPLAVVFTAGLGLGCSASQSPLPEAAAAASDLPSLEANGLRFAYLEAGSGDAPLVLLVHGFPDTAHSFRDMLPVLADNGYRAVAPFTRGVFPTAIPADGDYSVNALGRDVLGWMDAFGADSAIVIGHDWGAAAAYEATRLAPERVDKLVTVAIPHPRALEFTFTGLWRGSHFVSFQMPWAESSLRADDFEKVDELYAQWAPNWEVSAEELATVKEAYAHPGVVEAVIGYYQALPLTGIPDELKEKTSVPTLCFQGLADGAGDGDLFEATPEAFTGPYRLVEWEGVGHFPHRERPDEFAAEVLDFLGAPVDAGGSSSP